MKWFLLIVLSVCCAAQEFLLEIAKLPTLTPTSNEVNSTRIIGGTPANIQNYPYIVQVLYQRRLVCGGSLVTWRHVLTSAHCFFDERGNVVSHTQFTVLAGSSALESGGTTRTVSRVVYHERYNTPIRDNDVAVMVLSSRLNPSSTISVAIVPVQGDEVPDNSTVTHLGWGVTNVNAATISQTLQEVDIRTISFETCRDQYLLLGNLTNQPYPVTRSMICSGLLGVGGKDACNGDSGGPLLYRGIVVGVTSWGYGCGEPLFPGVNAKTSAFTNWINATVTRYNASPPVGSISGLLLVVSLISSLILGSSSFK